MEHKMRLIDTQLKATVKPFKRYPEIQRWKAMFKKVQSRYPFLVLEGSSCTGKTFFAKWMDGDPKYCYECNCACSQDPTTRIRPASASNDPLRRRITKHGHPTEEAFSSSPGICQHGEQCHQLPCIHGYGIGYKNGGVQQ